MYCSQCAAPLSESDVYCPKCSRPVASFHRSENISQVEPIGETATVVHPRGRQSNGFFNWPAALLGAIAGSVLTLVVGGFILLIYTASHRPRQTETVANQNTARP